MHTEKLSSSLKQLLNNEAEKDVVIDVLLRLNQPMTGPVRTAIEKLGHIRTQAGDIITLTLPRTQLSSLSDLTEVIYIEAAQTMYPEAANFVHKRK